MLKAATTQQQQVQQAKKTNAAATGQTQSKAPPAVSAKGSPTLGGKKKTPQTKEEWEASLAEASWSGS
jgi:hypothetical protein